MQRHSCTHELSVNVSADGDWASDGLDVGLLHQDFSGLHGQATIRGKKQEVSHGLTGHIRELTRIARSEGPRVGACVL